MNAQSWQMFCSVPRLQTQTQPHTGEIARPSYLHLLQQADTQRRWQIQSTAMYVSGDSQARPLAVCKALVHTEADSAC